MRALDPAARGARDDQRHGGRRQRGEAQPDVERQEEDGGAGHQEQVRGELHQRLREELVQLVGVVVDARDQVAGLVLVEEVERQLLQLGEERIAQVEEHAAADAAHLLRLHVGRDQAGQIATPAGPRRTAGRRRSRGSRM